MNTMIGSIVVRLLFEDEKELERIEKEKQDDKQQDSLPRRK